MQFIIHNDIKNLQKSHIQSSVATILAIDLRVIDANTPNTGDGLLDHVTAHNQNLLNIVNTIFQQCHVHEYYHVILHDKSKMQILKIMEINKKYSNCIQAGYWKWKCSH